VATDGGFEPHEAIMSSWLQVYGARIVSSIRVFSREKREVLHRPEEFSKVRQLVNEILMAIREI